MVLWSHRYERPALLEPPFVRLYAQERRSAWWRGMVTDLPAWGGVVGLAVVCGVVAGWLMEVMK